MKWNIFFKYFRQYIDNDTIKALDNILGKSLILIEHIFNNMQSNKLEIIIDKFNHLAGFEIPNDDLDSLKEIIKDLWYELPLTNKIAIINEIERNDIELLSENFLKLS